LWIALVLAGGLIAETVLLIRLRSGSSATVAATEPTPPLVTHTPTAEKPKVDAKASVPDSSAPVASRFRETLLHEPTAISPIVGRKPKLGGEWGAYDPDATRFIPPNHALIEYNDGHEQGVLVVLIGDPERPETWKRLYDDADGSLDSGVEP
jgi:hypothetical protein